MGIVEKVEREGRDKEGRQHLPATLPHPHPPTTRRRNQRAKPRKPSPITVFANEGPLATQNRRGEKLEPQLARKRRKAILYQRISDHPYTRVECQQRFFILAKCNVSPTDCPLCQTR